MSEQLTPTELGTKPIGRLLLSYAVPAIIAMTASSLYNIVDSIVIGQVCGALAIHLAGELTESERDENASVEENK